MSGNKSTEQAPPDEEVREFWQKVGAFRDGLPGGQREALNAILAGAAEAAETAGEEQGEAAAFGQALVGFREGLPPQQREAFNSILAAGVAQLGAGGDEVQGYFEPISFALGTIFITGVVYGAKHSSEILKGNDPIAVGQQALKGKPKT
jgi:hypothetical protein